MVDNRYSFEEWINRAESNYLIGTAFDINNLPGKMYIDDLCFELQQSVEKAIKAILVKYGINFDKTHDISKLLKLVQNRTTIPIPPDIVKAARLTPHAIESRYPNWNNITNGEYNEALKIAKDTLEWAKSVVSEE